MHSEKHEFNQVFQNRPLKLQPGFLGQELLRDIQLLPAGFLGQELLRDIQLPPAG